MVNFNEISTDDAFFETSHHDFRGTDLNNISEDLVIDLIDEDFPCTRISKNVNYLMVQLTNKIDLPFKLNSVELEKCSKKIEDNIFTLRFTGVAISKKIPSKYRFIAT